MNASLSLQIGPRHEASESGLPILEGILQTPRGESSGKEKKPKFVDPSQSMLVSSTSSLLRKSLVRFLDSSTMEGDKAIYKPAFRDKAHRLTPEQQGRREGQDAQLARFIHRAGDAKQRAVESQAMRDEALARQIEMELNNPRASCTGGSDLPFSPRGVFKTPRVLAPGRTLGDPIPVKVDAVALKKIKEDVLPFLLQRIETVVVPPLKVQVDASEPNPFA